MGSGLKFDGLNLLPEFLDLDNTLLLMVHTDSSGSIYPIYPFNIYF